MNQFEHSIRTQLISFWEFLPTLCYAFLVFIAFLLVGYGVSGFIRRGFKRADFSQTYQSFFLKIVRWIFGIIGLLLALRVMGFAGIATSILAGGGVTAIVLGFAFRDIGENILAGFFLAFSRPFNVGDLIRSDDLEGRVKSVDLRHTHIRTADGCDIFIPSAQIFKLPLMNFTRDGLRRAQFTVGIDYADDARRAARLLLQVLESNEEIIMDPVPKSNITGFTPNYVELQVTFWINTFKQDIVLADIKADIMDQCRRKLIEENFTLSSSVTTALAVPPLSVSLTQAESRDE